LSWCSFSEFFLLEAEGLFIFQAIKYKGDRVNLFYKNKLLIEKNSLFFIWFFRKRNLEELGDKMGFEEEVSILL
jgi:hypothetical protein